MSRPHAPVLLLLALWAGEAHAQGAVRFEHVEALRPYLPEELWPHRGLFFHEGMPLEIGPAFRDYSPAAPYVEATRRHAGEAKLGPESSLEGYRAGQPFPMAEIDCANDPEAGAKLAWNFALRWDGARRKARFRFSYWDRGEELPLYYEGSVDGHRLAHRVEPQFAKQDGDVFRGDKRMEAWGVSVDAPFEARGILLMTWRYEAALNPSATTRHDDTWLYRPEKRRIRRVSLPRRSDAVAGTDFSFDDLGGFGGIVPQHQWECLGRQGLLAPMDATRRAYPYERDLDLGPSGLSYANERFELRHAVKLRMTPRGATHPYAWKDLYLDADSLEPLYAFAYDRRGALWKILWHDHRWSDEPGNTDYEGWEGVPEPRDLTVVSDAIANVQTQTGVRIDFWDRDGAAEPSTGRIRRFVDVGWSRGCR